MNEWMNEWINFIKNIIQDSLTYLPSENEKQI